MTDSRPQTAGTPTAGVPDVQLKGISKTYGATVANHRVDFNLAPGEIHVLLGENGAGKTTLMGTMFGMVVPDEGQILIDGEAVALESPHDALDRGIGMVHQHFMLVQDFTVAENVVLGSVSPADLVLRRKDIQRSVSEAAEQFGMGLDPAAKIRDLPIDTQQRVEILKLLYRGAKVLILDEPTSALGPAQIEALFATLKDLREAGHSVVMVTHKLSEVVEIADRATVLKAGRKVTTVRRGEFDERSLARAMTGQEIPEIEISSHAVRQTEPILSVRDLVVHAGAHLNAVHGVSLDVHAGEILGVAGVEGNGQRELLDALAGVSEIESGRIEVGGQDVTGASPRAMREAGMSVIHEDRHGWGLILDMTLAENLALTDVATGKALRYGLLNKRQIKATARKLLEEYDVRAPSPDALALSLSGGNQQKLVLARELAREPRAVIAANPASGLDIGAANYVRKRLLDVRDRDGAVLLISNDLEELIKLSDRVIVLYRGRIVYEAPIGEVSMGDLAMAMAGTQPDEVGTAGASDAAGDREA